MSRHHPVKVSTRQKGAERARRVVCLCGCLWTGHRRDRTGTPCQRCGCLEFHVKAAQER